MPSRQITNINPGKEFHNAQTPNTKHPNTRIPEHPTPDTRHLNTETRRWERATFWFLLITSLLRLTQLWRVELAPDEAYYWDWSRHLAWGYYDQGPFIAYLIRLTTLLFGTNEFGVRIGVWASCLGALICAYILAKRIFSPLAGFLTVVLLAATPLLTVGSLIATYDPPLVFFWALALVFLERALFGTNEAGQKRAWLWAGLAVGLGFLSKHTMLLLLPCLLLFLLISPPHRKWLRRPEPYAAFLITLLLYVGVLWWNAHHHWWTFGHLGYLAYKTKHTPLSRLGEFIGSQALLLGPGLFLACVAAGVQVFRYSRASSEEVRANKLYDATPNTEYPISEHLNTRTPETLFLFCHGFPVLLFFCLMALRSQVQANWAPCAWITPTILWAGWAALRLEEKKKKRKEEEKTEEQGTGNREQGTEDNAERGMRNDELDAHSSLITHHSSLPVLSTINYQLSTIFLTSALLTVLMLSPELRSAVGIRLQPKDDVTTQMYGWRDLAAHVQEVRKDMAKSGQPVFIAGNGYQYCALMGFYLPDHPPTYDMFLHWRLTMYAAHVERLEAHLGDNAIFFNDGESDVNDLRQIFERVEWDPPFPIRRAGSPTPIRYVHIARCYGYRRYTGLNWAVGG